LYEEKYFYIVHSLKTVDRKNIFYFFIKEKEGLKEASDNKNCTSIPKKFIFICPHHCIVKIIVVFIIKNIKIV